MATEKTRTDALRPYKFDPELDWAGGRAMTLRPCLACRRLVDKWDANGLCDPCHDDLQRDLEEIEDDLLPARRAHGGDRVMDLGL